MIELWNDKRELLVWFWSTYSDVLVRVALPYFLITREIKSVVPSMVTRRQNQKEKQDQDSALEMPTTYLAGL